VLSLGALYALLWVALGLHPWHRSTWLLENLLAFALLGFLGATLRRSPLSRASYTLIFVFLCLHAVGTHYTYTEVPYDAWCTALTGRSFNDWIGWERNNFDRVVHFAYGLLLVQPLREVVLRTAKVRGFWSHALPLALIMASSMLYELMEWGTSVLFGGGSGQAYVGAQGDEWDAHKDMALASLGALLATCLGAGRDWRHRRVAEPRRLASPGAEREAVPGEDARSRVPRGRK